MLRFFSLLMISLELCGRPGKSVVLERKKKKKEKNKNSHRNRSGRAPPALQAQPFPQSSKHTAAAVGAAAAAAARCRRLGRKHVRDGPDFVHQTHRQPLARARPRLGRHGRRRQRGQVRWSPGNDVLAPAEEAVI